MGDLLLVVGEMLGNLAIPRRGRTGKATKMKFITFQHQTRVHDNDHLMMNMASSLISHLERKPISLALELLWIANRADNDTDNQCIFEEVGVWRGSITPARRLKLAPVKGNHLITQLCSKMDVSGKKEQRKETELDECWLKFTRKVTPKTGVDCKFIGKNSLQRRVALCCCLRC